MNLEIISTWKDYLQPMTLKHEIPLKMPEHCLFLWLKNCLAGLLLNLQFYKQVSSLSPSQICAAEPKASNKYSDKVLEILVLKKLNSCVLACICQKQYRKLIKHEELIKKFICGIQGDKNCLVFKIVIIMLIGSFLSRKKTWKFL